MKNMASCLAVNGDTIHVVWSDRHPAGAAIYYRRSVDTGLTWQPEVPLTDTFGSGAFPAIAVSGNVVHVVWMDTSLHHRASFYKRSTDGGNTWGATYILDSNTSFWPGLAASGNLVAATLNITVAAGNTEVFLRTSMDGGATWAPKQQVSNAVGRSEDPAVAVQGRHIHLSWNDNRSGTMVIFYRHSADAGATWSAETPMTTFNSYTSMVCLDGAHVDVPYGYNPSSSNFDVNMRQSSDTGATFGVAKVLASTTAAEIYPYLIRRDSQMHMVYVGAGPTYIHSADGGLTWSAPVNIGHGGQPFIAMTCPVLHVIWPDSGAIYYRRNATGNPPCVTTGPGPGLGIVSVAANDGARIYPNPNHGIFYARGSISAFEKLNCVFMMLPAE